jgi:hypothetical protein
MCLRRGCCARLQSFDCLFQVNAARAFHQDRIAAAQILLEPLSGGCRIGQEKRRDATRAGRGGEVLGVAAYADNEIEPGIGGSFAALRMERGRVLAELEHFTRN